MGVQVMPTKGVHVLNNDAQKGEKLASGGAASFLDRVTALDGAGTAAGGGSAAGGTASNDRGGKSSSDESRELELHDEVNEKR
ncbi:hypothetical protein NP233_g1528 [Leucocoprinus birnbaumii]|uniref:Uncharacterized protein n=1 Tax=Leucocoprinus birnbaumii TaxID=56174 RepID=A0AAD5W0E1_9AGAR|nr:hypothetical protein NP233_g1528 [Leucocoprinus birnbaumii]